MVTGLQASVRPLISFRVAIVGWGDSKILDGKDIERFDGRGNGFWGCKRTGHELVGSVSITGMKEVVIKTPPVLDETQKRIADLHSLFNVLNVVSVSLDIAWMSARSPLNEGVDRLRGEIAKVVSDLRGGAVVPDLLGYAHGLSSRVMEAIDELIENVPAGRDRTDLVETRENLESIFSILDVRLAELEKRAKDPDVWVSMGVEDFRRLFEDVFVAIEKNSRGRYRIFFNLARKGEGDYYININVESSRPAGDLWIPVRLIDVLRDLTANARKYTEPGGRIALAVYQSESEVRAMIEDSGSGIPEDDLERVVEFGYRAGNTSAKATMGGGFGLTKAALLVPQWGGTIKIASEQGVGTLIEIIFPCDTA